MLWRVYAEAETGEHLIVVDRIHDRSRAQDIADEAAEDHEEWRAVWVQKHPFFESLGTDDPA